MPLNDFEELRERYELLTTQSQLVDAVLAPPGGDPAAMAPADLIPMPGIRGGMAQALQAYRMHASTLADRALTAIYPRLRERMDAESAGSFAALAWSCWRRQGPTQGDLGDWGETLIERLAQAHQEDGVPAAWIAIARMEWALHEVERQSDPDTELGSLALLGRLSPSVLRLSLSDLLVLQRCEGAELAEVAALPEEAFGDGPRVALMVWREGWQGRVIALDRPALRWCEALQQGLDLERALMAAGPGFDFGAWLPAAVARGWLGRVDSVDMATTHPLTSGR